MRAEETDEALAAALRAAGVALSPSQLHGLVGDGADALTPLIRPSRSTS